MPLPLWKALKYLAVHQAQPLNEVVIRALTDFWEHHPEHKKFAHLVDEKTERGRRR